MTITFRILAVGLAAGAYSGCGKSSLADLRLESGAQIADFLEVSDSVAVVLVDPSMCLSCDPDVTTIAKMRKARPERIRVVLIRKPTPSERRHLILERFPSDGYLRMAIFARLTRGPGVLFLSRGESPVFSQIPAATRRLADMR